MTRQTLAALGCAIIVGSASAVGANTLAGGAQHTVVVTPSGAVWTWGANGNGQLGDGTTTSHKGPEVVSTLTGVTAVAAGEFHTLALKSDGTVWAWGLNGNGQLGDGTTTQRTEPVLVTGLSNVVAIAAGGAHSLALTSGGSVYVWGRNANGQLGLGNTTQQTQPALITTLTSVAAIGAGYNHSLAVKTDGTAWAWGVNTNGQLGDASTTQRTSPVQMSSVTGAAAVAGGSAHSLVLKTDGTVRSVGHNGFGQLGDGTITQRTSTVSTGMTSVAEIAAGQNTSYARRTDGALWAWGTNVLGQVGDGTTTQRNSPVQLTTVSSIGPIGGGYSHALAATSTGVVATWGSNAYGQLGDGTTANRSTPGAISDANYAWKVGTPVFSVAAGTYNTTKSVVVTCATSGADIHYTLDGATPTAFDTVIANGGSLPIDETRTLKAIALNPGMPGSDLASATYTLAVASVTLSPTGGTYTSAQTVSMSTTSPGVTIRYTLDGSTPDVSSAEYTAPLTIGTSTTVKAVGFRYNWTSSAVASATYTMNFGTLAAPVLSPGTGTYTSEAVVSMSALAGATIRYTTNGQTPTTSSTAYGGPLSVTATTTIIAKAFHPDYTASATSTATYTIVVATPVISPTAGTYTAGQVITASTATAGATLTYTTNGVAPTSTSSVFPAGGIVAGNFTLKMAAWKTGATPSAVVTVSYQVTGTLAAARITGGDAHSIASRPDGVAFGWGTNTYGQVGDGTTTTRSLPVIVNGAAGIVAIAAGDLHSVAVTSSGDVFAWGNNGNGRLGDGTTTARTLPTAVQGLSSVAAVGAGGSHSLALKTDGTVWAWGYNASGQLGTGDTTQQLTPVQASGLTNVTALATGGSSSFAVGSSGAVWSWGNNGNGQLATGNTTGRSTPGQISGLTGVTAVSTGGSHAVALLSDGTVRGWGFNQYGQVGDGTTTQRTSPVTVSGLSNAIAVVAGSQHALALLNDGTVWAWGSNANGAIGDGTSTNRSTPVAVGGLPSIATIGAGAYHSLAIAVDGSVWAWGRNVGSQLGDGTATVRTSPVQIAGPEMMWKIATPVLSVASGLYSTAQTVTVTCADPDAVLHYTTDGTNPTEGAPAIASGSTVAIDQSRTLKVRAWKPGAISSELVTGTYELKVIAPVLSPLSGAYASAQSVTLSSGTPSATFTYTIDGTEPAVSSPAYAGSIAVADTRSVKARAYKAGWTASDSVTASYWISAGVVATPAIAPAAGTYTSAPLVTLACATPGATMRYTLDGSDPTDASARYQYPFLVEASATLKVRAFKAGFAASAIASAAYSLDAAGQTAMPLVVPGGGRFATAQTVHITGPAGATLRDTTTGVDPTDTDTVVPVSGDLTVSQSQILKVRAWLTGSDPSAVRRADFVITGAIASGRQHSLALASDGQVWAWGRSSEGEVGNGGQALVTTPTAVLTNAVAIAAAGWSSLAVRADGTVWHWGATAGGGSSFVPVQVTGLTEVAAVAAGWNHALALKRDGAVWAWGANPSGELGDGTTTTHTTPAPVLGLSGVTSVAAGDGFSLAVQGDGAAGGLVWAWGKNTTGQLGDGSLLNRVVPVRAIGLDAVAQVAAGDAFGIARLADGTVRAWGADESLQLGDLVAATGPVPVTIPVLAHIVSIAAGNTHAIAIDDEGRAWGWGSNASAQLGQPNYNPALGAGAPLLVPDATAILAASGGTWDTLLLRADGTVWYSGYGNGQPTSDHVTVVPSLTLADNTSLFVDADGDGLLGWQEVLAGTDRLRIDTNGNGLSDLVDVRRGGASANPDDDADGVPNGVEAARGTDPFRADTDGDGVSDLTDAFPLDATRWLPPVVDPNDHTPPVITLTYPTSARPVGGGN